MKIKNLTIKAHYLCGELSYFSFHRDNKEKSFDTLDGGWCTHETFKMVRDMYNHMFYNQLREYVVNTYSREPIYFNVVKVDSLTTTEEEIFNNYPRVFTLEELL